MSREVESLFRKVDNVSLEDVFVRNSRAFLRKILPPRAAEFLWYAALPQPKSKPMTIKIGAAQAHFWAATRVDRYRLYSAQTERVYNEAVINTIKKRRNPVFLDVGAAEGFYSLLAASAGAMVYAFDPHTSSHVSFERNLEINPDAHGHVNYFPLALGDEVGTVVLYVDDRSLHAPSMRPIYSRLDTKMKAPMRTVDGLIEAGLIEQPDVIKIDVEGAETKVLAGMRGLLNQRTSLDLFLEIHPRYLDEFGSSAFEVVDIIKGHGLREETVHRRDNEYLCHFSRD